MALAGGDKMFKSVVTNKYVRRIDENQLSQYLSADGDCDNNQMVEFRLEQASNGSGMCHIKCRGTNKYWQVKSSNMSWITADADARNENENSLACTLFDIEYFGTPPTTTIRLRHRYLKRYACLYKADDHPFCLCALADNIDKASKDVFVYSESV
ncbi:unnamed protein product [Camellia sinensis]